MSQNNYLNSLTGLRGLAALLVTLSHITSHSTSGVISVGSMGHLSVAVFFSLSGFLMGYIYTEKSFDRQMVHSYIISRTSRIAPAYLTVVIISFILFSFIDPAFPIQIDTNNLARHLLFSGNQSILWSIPPEIQFYALFLLFWYSLDSYRKKKQTLNLILFVSSCVLMMALSSKMPGTFVGSKIEYFIFGVVVGLYRKRTHLPLLEKYSLKPILQLLLIGPLIYFSINIINHNQTAHEFWSHQYYAIISCITVYLFSFQTRLTELLFNNQVMQNLGLWSFSLYLTHTISLYYFSKVIKIDTLNEEILALLVAIVSSFFFYSMIESPGIKLARRLLISVGRRN